MRVRARANFSRNPRARACACALKKRSARACVRARANTRAYFSRYIFKFFWRESRFFQVIFLWIMFYKHFIPIIAYQGVFKNSKKLFFFVEIFANFSRKEKKTPNFEEKPFFSYSHACAHVRSFYLRVRVRARAQAFENLACECVRVRKHARTRTCFFQLWSKPGSFAPGPPLRVTSP